MHPTRAKYPPFRAAWAGSQDGSSKSRERMFCHVAPIRMPCSRSLPCRPVDLICRIEGVASSYTYAPDCMSLTVAAIVNSALSFVSGRAEYFPLADRPLPLMWSPISASSEPNGVLSPDLLAELGWSFPGLAPGGRDLDVSGGHGCPAADWFCGVSGFPSQGRCGRAAGRGRRLPRSRARSDGCSAGWHHPWHAAGQRCGWRRGLRWAGSPAGPSSPGLLRPSGAQDFVARSYEKGDAGRCRSKKAAAARHSFG